MRRNCLRAVVSAANAPPGGHLQPLASVGRIAVAREGEPMDFRARHRCGGLNKALGAEEVATEVGT